MTKFLLIAPVAALSILCGLLSCTQLPQGDLVGTNTVTVTNYSTVVSATNVTNTVQFTNTNTVTNATKVTNSILLTNTNMLELTNSILLTNTNTLDLTNTISLTNPDTVNVTNTTEWTNTNTVTNSVTNQLTNTIIRISNIASIYIITNTNDSQSAVQLGDFSNFVGVWMVQTNSYKGTVNTTDSNGFVTESTAFLTNVWSSLNSGTNGACTFRFNGDSSVDMFVYDAVGNIMETNYNYRTFAVYSNTTLPASDPNCLYLELTDPATMTETVYWTPAGEIVSVVTTNVYTVTNFSNSTVLAVSNVTNIDSFGVAVTNSWTKHSQATREVESYVYGLSITGPETNLTWKPNTITNQNPGRWSAPRRKSLGEITITTMADADGNGSVSTMTTFEQQPWSSWSLVKITNTY